MNEEMLLQPTLWNEHRSSIRSGNTGMEAMMKLSSPNSLKESSDYFETRETASALPTLEEISSENYNSPKTQSEIIIDRIQRSKQNIVELREEFDKLQEKFTKNESEICGLGKETVRCFKLLRNRD